MAVAAVTVANADRRATVAPALLAWAHGHGRHDLPWQHPATPYRVWVSEIMLQQTQVATVIPYFERFTARLPDLPALAAIELYDVLALWSGLGYYARARNLHRAARQCCEIHGGKLPDALDTLVALPGIGRSTAGAILALGFGQRAAILDGNVKRVLARYHGVEGWPGTAATQRALWTHAEMETPQHDVTAYTQAIMDLGATVCTRSAPACERCPLTSDCVARIAGAQALYPAPRPRRVRPRRETAFAWVESDGCLLLEQRPPTGIWGGLLCLPEIPPAQTPHTWCRQTFGSAPNSVAEQPGFEHEFTHFHLSANVIALQARSSQVSDSAMLRWLSPETALSAGLPAPIRRYIETRLALA